MPNEDTERQIAAKIAVHESWARTDDRSARTAKAREAFEARFLEQAGGDPVKAKHLRKAHYLRLALKSATARRKLKEAREAEAEAAEYYRDETNWAQ